MARQLNRLVKILTYLLLLLLLPIVWTAHSTYTFEHYLTSLSITLSDFPPSYAAALTKATLKSEHTFDFDYSIFSLHSANNTDSSNGSTFSAVHATSRNTIPPIVHFIWFADLYDTTLGEHKNAIPHSRSHAPKRCRLFNPSYTINIWNASAAESFLEEHYAWILPTYHSYPYPIQRIDLLKYFLLYHFGGVYMDLDIACRRPLEPLLEFAAWIPKASPMGVNNDLIAARPGHPLLEYMTGRLPDRNRWLGSEWLTVFWSTGPRFASDMLREWYDTRPGERHVASYTKSADAYPNAFFILPEQFYSQDPGYTFFGHSPGGTWYGDDAKFVVWLLDRPWVIVIIIGTPIALYTALAVRKRRAVGRRNTKM